MLFDHLRLRFLRILYFTMHRLKAERLRLAKVPIKNKRKGYSPAFVFHKILTLLKIELSLQNVIRDEKANGTDHECK